MRSLIVALFAGLAAVASATADVVEERDVFDVSIGVIIERSPVPGSSLTERSISGPQHQTTILQRDASGNFIFPRTPEEAEEMEKRGLQAGHMRNNGLTKRSSAFNSIITWYTGHDLLNPSCIGWQGEKWNPTDDSMVGALTINWPGKPKCGQFVKLWIPGTKKSVTVRIMDSCAGCQSGSKHVDLTQGAFKKLFGLNKGLATVKCQIVGAPKNWDKNLYGPKSLN